MPKSKTTIIAVGVVVLVLVGVGVYLLLNRNTGGTSPEDIVANAPIGCPSSTSVVVKSDEAGTQNITTSNSYFIRDTLSQGRLVFTNYTLNTDSVYSDITEGRVLTIVKLSHQDGTTMTDGTYRKTGVDSTETPNQYTSEYNISTVDLAGGVFDNDASVEITYIGTDYVCGTITSQDSSSGINGDFISKYVSKL